MKKLLLILGLLTLSSTSAFAADEQSMNGAMQDVNASNLSSCQLINLDNSKISRVNQPTAAQEKKLNITQFNSQKPSFVTAFAPPDRGSPPTRGEGGKEGSATR